MTRSLGRVGFVERFIEHTNEFPRTWTPAMVEELFSDLRSVKRRKQSTVGLLDVLATIGDATTGQQRTHLSM
jgi:hypothetical protein